MGLLTKEEFVKYLNEIKKVFDFDEGINDLFYSVDRDNFIQFPSLVEEVIALIKLCIGGDKSDWIGYYCWELNFGKNWKCGMITSRNGKDIKLETIDDLWNLLVDLSVRSDNAEDDVPAKSANAKYSSLFNLVYGK